MTNGKTYGIVHTEIEIHERKCDHEGYFFRHLLHERTTGCFRAGKQLPRSASMAGEAREGTSDRRYGIPGVTGLPGHTSFGDRYKPPAWRKKAGGFLRLRISELVRR